MSDLSLMNQKIPATSIPKMVADLIQFELAKVGAFNNGSLAYWGADMKFSIELTVYARGEEKILLDGQSIIGEPAMGDPMPPVSISKEVRTGMTGKPATVKGKP